MSSQVELLSNKVSSRVHWHYRSIATIVLGEGFARLCNLALLVFISRRFGVRVTGAYALAQTLALYLIQGIDLGLRHIGARLVASNTASIRSITRAVQSKRLLLAIPVISFGYLYGRFGPVPADTRSMVSLYALSMTGYALSLDWLAWGMKRFAWVSGWRALVSVFSLGITIFAAERFQSGPTIIAPANALAYILAAYLLWQLWAKRNRTPESSGLKDDLRPTISWIGILTLGSAMLVNQLFSSIDVMMLGSLSDSTQTGLYSAAYRILLLTLAFYYMAIESIYPQLAAIPSSERGFQTLWCYLWKLMLIGLLVMGLMEALRKPLIMMFYGTAFAASVRLSMPILFAIPLELCGSLLLTALIAWDHSSLALAATTVAALSNILLNLWLIPIYGAMGAAYATPVSYGFLLVALLICLRRSSSGSISDTVTRLTGAVRR